MSSRRIIPYDAVMPGRRETPAAAAAVALTGITLLAAACSSGHPMAGASASASASFAPRKVLAARYLAIAKDPNKHLDADFDGLRKSDHHNLALAKEQLRDMAATEHRFDRLLLTIRFPPEIETTAHALVWTNENRAAIATRAARSRTLKQLRGYEQQLNAANGPLEQAVRLIRKQLGLPPPETD
jgi:hypothetical protein